ncbi:ER lumen protein-retaining receptor A-like isoform X2 [Primulina huaijiensis]|uniref:ER lumen protein-retaining receptor A-like isoform X2 n=1 Tax=Primulina huaijiensis TaxID=1492673 RepID=UPI003CC786D1
MPPNRAQVGISFRTQELYTIVFLARYLDLFTDFISVYNAVMKLVFVGSSLAIVYCMRFHHVVRRSYDRELDTFRHYLLVVFCSLLALLVHENFTFQERLSSILHPELGIPLLHRAAFQSMDFLRVWASPNSSICRLFLLLLHQPEKQRETEVASLIQTRLHLVHQYN